MDCVQCAAFIEERVTLFFPERYAEALSHIEECDSCGEEFAYLAEIYIEVIELSHKVLSTPPDDLDPAIRNAVEALVRREE